ncbi:MAG: hypothetical protein U9N35_05750 [Euryarchaeota archaeon]|nr:hypothetical protein [Euryarchaeota archaeon]
MRGQNTGRGQGSGQGAGRGQGSGQGAGRGRMGGQAQGPGGNCVCPKCGYTTKHQLGTPCYQMKCPECGTQLRRG